MELQTWIEMETILQLRPYLGMEKFFFKLKIILIFGLFFHVRAWGWWYLVWDLGSLFYTNYTMSYISANQAFFFLILQVKPLKKIRF